jgi:hypothetical protein
MERSGIREQTLKRRLIFPDSAALHPGYKIPLRFIRATSWDSAALHPGYKLASRLSDLGTIPC